MVEVVVKPAQFQAVNPEQLPVRYRRIDQRSQDIEEGAHTERLPYRGDGLQGGIEELCVQECHVAAVQRTFEPVDFTGEFYAVRLDDVRRTAHGSRSVVAVLDYRKSGCGGYHAGCGRNVEGVFVVSARTDDVDCIVVGQVDRYAHFKQRFAESDEFVERNAPHQEYRDEGGDLAVVVLSAGHVQQYVARFVAVEVAVFEKAV